MTGLIDGAVVEGFRSALSRRLGFQFDDGKLEELEGLLRWRLETSAEPNAAAYLQSLTSGRSSRVDPAEEWRALVAKITVSETYFLRNAAQFRAFSEIVLPELLRARGPGRRLRLLSAGCSSGEEPYSLAMSVDERLGDAAPRDVEIIAIDVNASVLAKAKRGRYSVWALRETPEDVRRSCFTSQGAEFLLNEKIRALVSFEEKNVCDPDPNFWRPGRFDVIFCRNMLMYFSPEAARAAVSKLSDSLAPGGHLFLGHAETLRGLSSDFQLCHTHGTFYYRKRGPADAPPERARPDALAADGSTAERADANEASDPAAWMDAINSASDRIAGLAARGADFAAAPARAERPQWSLGLAMELLRQERFSEALALVRELPPESATDPDVRMLTAVLLANSLSLDDAERVCREMLAADDLNAGAHYVMALCREHAGDLPGALAHDQTAAYLDPGFAMPCLHMGLIAKRMGERRAGERGLARALALLQREDPARILLFGGGFTREALMRLCQAAHRREGGRS